MKKTTLPEEVNFFKLFAEFLKTSTPPLRASAMKNQVRCIKTGLKWLHYANPSFAPHKLLLVGSAGTGSNFHGLRNSANS